MRIIYRIAGMGCMGGAAVLSYSGDTQTATFYVAMAVFFRVLLLEPRP